ncbi:hypothetical protein [Actinomadura kijaniata]|uniref:hypothetical protein n=1 Tax=Actinomadura kijaniata TaxID=46161 RepID=UPI00082EB3A8|nr:hypothetical protein [Actinomadura kijaniata]
MTIASVLRDLYHHEHDMARDLLHVSDVHKAEHEVHRTARELAERSRGHLAGIAEAARRFGADLDPDPPVEPGLVERLRDKGAELAGLHPASGLALLHDLRRVHTRAAEISVEWEMLDRTAEAARDEDLLATVRRCHPETLRQRSWAAAHIRQAAPRILLS